MKKLLMILTVTAFAVVANAGDACCAAKKDQASANKASCSAKAATCSAEKAAMCTGDKAASCKASCKTVTMKKLKSPRDASQS